MFLGLAIAIEVRNKFGQLKDSRVTDWTRQDVLLIKYRNHAQGMSSLWCHYRRPAGPHRHKI